MRSYGERIKDLRKNGGYTQKEFAALLSIAPSNLSVVEKSTHPSLAIIEKVCQLLDIPIYQFFLDDEIKFKETLPSYIEPNDAHFLKILNTQISQERRIEIKKIFLTS